MSNELHPIAGHSMTGVVDGAKLGYQAFELNEIGSASPTIDSSSNDLKEESPRHLHGWKVCQIYKVPCLFAESSSVGDSIRFDAVHHISFRAGQHHCMSSHQGAIHTHDLQLLTYKNKSGRRYPARHPRRLRPG